MASVPTVPAQPSIDRLSKFLMILFAPYPGGFPVRGVDPDTAPVPGVSKAMLLSCVARICPWGLCCLWSPAGVVFWRWTFVVSSLPPGTLGNSLGRSEGEHVLCGFCNVVWAVGRLCFCSQLLEQGFPFQFLIFFFF